MKNGCKRILTFGWFFAAFIFLGISKLTAQPADSRPIIKYAINNYAAISEAVCESCPVVVGKPLRVNRPIPFPPLAVVNAIPGVDIDQIPGIAAPNFLGGGSPDIKGLVKTVTGMTDGFAWLSSKGPLPKSRDTLYFRTGATGIAVTESGKIMTSSGTILPGERFDDQNLLYGFFSFISKPERLPQFNSTSERKFEQSPAKILVYNDEEDEFDEEVNRSYTEISYFAVDPDNEKIIYAALRNPDHSKSIEKILVRKNPDNGKWEWLECDIPGLREGAWGAMAVDYDGNLYIADAEHHVIVKVEFDNDGRPERWQIIAGKANTAGFKDDEDGDDARFNKPSGICVDKAGNIYVGDFGNNAIRKIDEDGEVITYAGDKDGKAGFKDDDLWSKARFDGPTALAYNEKYKTLYVVDFNNKTVREINDKREVSTLAGIAGKADPRTDLTGFAMNLYYYLALLNMDPDEAKFDNLTGIAIDPSGEGLYVGDGNYIKYVSTFKALFTVTSSIRSPDAKVNLHGAPILPPGVFINPNNGSFFGFPTVEWEPTVYTVSAINRAGSSLANGFIRFEVIKCPAAPDTVVANKTISPKQLPFTWNGKVFNKSEDAYVTLKSSDGCDSVVLMKLLVGGEFNYKCEPYIFSLGQQINSILPTIAGSKIDSFSVSPALPDGLTLNTKTGEISGTPTVSVASQIFPAVGPKTPVAYPAPWKLTQYWGADITQVKISDCNEQTVFENNSSFNSLQGSTGPGTGTPGSYTDFSGLGAIKMSSNTLYSIRLSNALGDRYVSPLNQTRGMYNFMNSYAVYIDYNRDGDFEDAGERVYISGAPQRDAHAEVFNLNIPGTATAGVTKMRIYCVEASTKPSIYFFNYGINNYKRVSRTTEQALSFYPFFNDISTQGESDLFVYSLNYGEFEDYNIEITTPSTKAYTITGSNNVGTSQATIRLAVNNPSTSTTNTTICSTELPYNWNGLVFSSAGTQTAHIINRFGADSAATLNLTVKQATSSVIAVEHCGPYTYQGKVYTQSGDYSVHITNSVGCDSAIIFRFRQKATASVTNIDVIPGQLPYSWNGKIFTFSSSQSATLTNAEGCDSVATLNLRVVYNIYYPAINILPVNQAITPITRQIEGNYPVVLHPATQSYDGYNISPALPNGLSLDPISGTISGTPTQVSPLKTYTVTLRQNGAKPTSFQLSVGVPSASVSTINNCGPYTWNGVEYTTPTTVSASFKNQYGFDSTATLILSIRNPSVTITNILVNQSELPVTWNGINITREGTKTVYLVNAAGCDSAVTVNVTVVPDVSYQSPNILRQHQAIAPISPENTGGAIPSVIGNVSTLIKTNYLSPISIALDAENNSYVSDELQGKIYKINRRGIVSVVDGFGTTQALLAIDKAGNIYAADKLSNRVIKKDKTGVITVLASASSPSGIAVDADGNVYFSESRYHRIRKISSAGVVSTLAGGTTAGYANGNGTAAKFNTPSGLCVDEDGNVYVADLLNNKIRKITATGDVTSYAGNGSANSVNGSSNSAGFNAPVDIAADNLGNKYVVDNGSSKIRKIDAAGVVSTLAGTTAGYLDGTSSEAKFNLPVSLTTDLHGQVYVADRANAVIRQINAINYAIQPALVNGLQFDEATGIISGIPADTLLQPVTYTIYAFNKAGADSSNMIIGVCNPVATSFTLDTCNQYVWNDSTYTSSTTHTRYLKNRGGCDSVVTMHLIIRKGSIGATTTATACGSYVWKGTTYNQSGLYTKVYPNSVGCDSTIYLNLTIKNLSYNNLFVDINPLQLPYTWRGKVFTVPGKDSIVIVNGNSVGCDSIITMTVRVSTLLPNISYATRDTVLYWEKKIEVPIAMTNTGAPIPQMKIAERDTLINFSNNGPGDNLRNTVKGLDGAYYTSEYYSNQIFKLSSTGVWTVFAAPSGSSVKAMAVDKLGNMYVGTNELPTRVIKITPDGVTSTLNGSPWFYGLDAMSVDADNNLVIAAQKIDNQLQITKFNLSTSQYVQTYMDYSPYVVLAGDLSMKIDSKGSIYVYAMGGTSIMKIKPNGQVSGIGQKGSLYYQFRAGNGTDAAMGLIFSMAIDSTNDNVYVMAYGTLVRIDTSANVNVLTGSWFEQYKDQIFRVDNGKISIVNNTARILYTANVYGIGSIPFMDNYGGNTLPFNGPKTDFKNFDKRIRLDSTGAIVGTPRGNYTTQGNFYATNTAAVYSIVGANQHGIGTYNMVITTKSITYIDETLVTTSLPYTWRGRVFNAPTDTATYFATNKTAANDTLYTLHLIYEVPEPIITTTGNCTRGEMTLTANAAAKNAISLDGTNVAIIKNVQNGSGIPYFNSNAYTKPGGGFGVNPSSAYEVWIKPTTVSGTQYIFTKDTVQAHAAFIGLSIQNGKLVYEFTKGNPTAVAYKLTSGSSIAANVWTHIAASYYDSALHVFINGQLDGTLQTPNSFFTAIYVDPATSTNTFPDFYLGGLGRQFGYKGEMDELRIWNTVKDKTAIVSTMNTLVNPLSTGLALYYRFNGAVSDSALDISRSHRWAKLKKPAISVSPSLAPINFASYSWMPGGATTKSITVKPTSSMLYTLTVTDYKGTSGSSSLLVPTLASNTVETIIICGNSYSWHGNTYTSSTNAPTWKGQNQYGCDSIVTLHLTLNPLPTPVITGVNGICPGGSATLTANGYSSYVWLPGGETSASITVQPNASSTYTLEVTDANGCKASVAKTIEVNKPSSFTEKITACGSYTWHGNKYTSSNNTATWLGVNAAGCDSLVTLDLLIHPLAPSAIVAANGEANCLDNPVQITVRASGNQLLLDGSSRVVIDAMGVDPSTGFTLEGWVNFSSIGTPQSIISQTTGNTPLPFDAWLNANGTISFAVGDGVSTSSITTTATLTAKSWRHIAFIYSNKTIAIYMDGISRATGVAVLPTAGKLTNFMIGNNESLSRPMVGAVDEIRVWNKALSSGQITANMNLSVTHDGDGLVAYYKFDEADNELPVNTANATTTAMIVGNAIHGLSTAPIVYQSYNWTGGLTSPVITVADPNMLYKVTVTDVNGCTAEVSGKAMVSVSSTFTEIVKACGPYTWHGVTYTSSNNTSKWTTKNAAGCDSVVTLNLSIGVPSASTETAVACNYFVWHGNTYTKSTNTATWHTVNAAGCDSVVTLHLTITNAIERTDTVTACGAYSWHDSTYTASTNTPVWYGTSANGCDSIVHLNLTITDFPVAAINAVKSPGACFGTGIILNNVTKAFTQYASRVNAFSSEMTENENRQILGAPDTYPDYGDFARAWSTNNDKLRREFIELSFDNDQPINFIDIYETLNGGTIDTVYIKNPGTNAFEVVYIGSAELYNQPLQNRISFPLTGYGVSTIRLAINSINKPAQKSIDAVAIGIANSNSYRWSDGSVADTLTISQQGQYVLTATNEFGCSASDTFNLSSADIQQFNRNMLLASAHQTISKNLIAGATSIFEKDCELIASLQSTGGASAVSGTVTGKVWLETTTPLLNGRPFVNRHYEITPENNADNATGIITLYFTQADFDAYNAFVVNGPRLPEYPDDEEGKLNFAIYKYSGISSDGTGLPGTYPHPALLIRWPAVSLTWDDVNFYWKASFATTGFSGFFAGSATTTVLPINDLLTFEVLKSGNEGVINWQLVAGHQVSQFVVEKSYDGNHFTAFQTVVAKADSTHYQVIDQTLQTGLQYYRLKLIEKDGSIVYSAVRVLLVNSNQVFAVAPNPTRGRFIIDLQIEGQPNTTAQIQLQDITGKIVLTQKAGMNAGVLKQSVNMPASAAAGVYLVMVMVEGKTYHAKIVFEK